MWQHHPKHKHLQESVVEGLARWFEYNWCENNKTNNDIYQWRQSMLKHEMLTYTYPDWPYAAAKAFFHKGTMFYNEALKVLQTSLLQTKNHWREAYTTLVRFDRYHQKPDSLTP